MIIGCRTKTMIQTVYVVYIYYIYTLVQGVPPFKKTVIYTTDLNAVVEHWDLLSPTLDPKSSGFDQNSPQMARYAS